MLLTTLRGVNTGVQGFEKGRQVPVGTESMHGRKKVVKTAQGWRPVKEEKKKEVVVTKDNLKELFDGDNIEVFLKMEKKQSMTAIGKDGSTYNVYVEETDTHPHTGDERNSKFKVVRVEM